ncbi:hypothetical protein NC653_040435 [Populus alba x Populus x berolinensis]|uniref:Uncharacterized protein n=1 Tax=Populus alba x Populus x berolinensis TaxID=444605 RepID=A0AAD6PRW8_9ROSI|nr:hypothetical protein NC653_040435 [Populus alba x Populus x berolinensis]
MGYWFLSLDLKQENLPLISPPTVHVLRHQWEYSCEKAKTELGYNPRSLEDGLKEVLPWFEEPWDSCDRRVRFRRRGTVPHPH